MSEIEMKTVDAVWFDGEGIGPFPLGGNMQLRARMFSSYHPEFPIDDLTFRVVIEAMLFETVPNPVNLCFGHQFMSVPELQSVISCVYYDD